MSAGQAVREAKPAKTNHLFYIVFKFLMLIFYLDTQGVDSYNNRGGVKQIYNGRQTTGNISRRSEGKSLISLYKNIC